MAHFIFSVVVVLLWLVAWGIYLVFRKRVKHPNAKAIGLPDVGGEFGSYSVSLMDFTEFDLQCIPYSSHASYLIKA
ncbi:hypothetical protein [Helicobacter pylori]|uniref:hypothetical protein n=1 Tax=Helicobacter pylori TaxID=210 RepID=UPI001FD50D6A|nr:hypothetical protein [Helicobacter pylori]UOS01868.1 hypothetical protein MPG78_01255 [Helicobacter pylori]